MNSTAIQNVLPFVGMVIAVLAQVSELEVLKAAMSNGSERPPLTFSTLSKIFLLAAFGCLIRLFTYGGIELSSPTLSTAIVNLLPAFTFILAIIFRMEKINWRSRSSQAKLLGTLVSIAGAFVVTFYQGPPIFKTLSLLSSKSNWIIGGFFLGCAAFFGAAWYILQAIILNKFPAIIIILLFKYFFGAILAALFSVFVVRDPSAWKLGLDIGLVAILYSTIMGSVIQVSLCTWCLSRTGPLYVSMFNPLAIVFSVAMDFFFLAETLCIGSLIGAIIIVIGFYSVMWGKTKEEKFEHTTAVLRSHRSYDEKVPLLQNEIEEVHNRSSV
ncbi:hypothetical protein JRO89_XS05G0075700 [Xanthoceras sorbifolium]|uniref:WAT1-related protein n=1 Tax=Xanthoceras sorbifolium TaxID=99658 RepID=A0ABQ8I115_9ROSI|nr:hypothetical protein JRO89_XS05G0075700 [Xanthoceras sorbifolium]